MSLFHQSTVHGSAGQSEADVPPPSQPSLSRRTEPSGSHTACGATRAQKSLEKSRRVPPFQSPTVTFQWWPPGHGQGWPPAALIHPIISLNFSSVG